MTTPVLFRLLLGASLVLALVQATPARACSRIAGTSVQALTTLPLDGGTAPRNTKLWQVTSLQDVGEFSLVDAKGASIPLQRSTIPVSGEATVNLEILTPMSLLDPGAFVFSRGGTALSRFTVTSEVDSVAPQRLAPTVTGAVGAYFGAYSCGGPSVLTLALGAEAELAVAVPEGQAWLPTSALGVATGATMVLTGLAEGDQRFVVLHVDVAGNATPGEPMTGKVPAKTSGCSAAGSGFPLGLLVLAVLRRRRLSTSG
jgi:uncharacterized protein (TIGR03382 family)